VTLRQRILAAALALAAVLGAGTLGYQLIEGWSFADALYMTVITVATIGYGEVHPLSPAGRTFTIFLIFGGIGLLTYAVSAVTAFLVEGELHEALRKRRLEKIIDHLKDHYIICGAGRTGRCVADELRNTRRDLVVVDQDPVRVAALNEQGVPALLGDADHDTVLKKAGIERAKALVACLPEDKDNLFVVITARGLNPNLRIVAKSLDKDADEKFRRSGADAVVSPHFIGGLRMASEAARPAVVSFLDNMLRHPDAGIRLEEVSVGGRARTVAEASASAGGVLVLALKPRGGSDYVFNPAPGTALSEKDVLVVMGRADEVKRLQSAFAAVA
jgi:voltage-gated potassium channel